MLHTKNTTSSFARFAIRSRRRGLNLGDDATGIMVTSSIRIHRQNGFTLIEMVVAISMISVMLTLAGMTFHLILRAEKSVSQSFVTERSISRLAIQFRDDVHRAEAGTINNDSQSSRSELNLDIASGSGIRYAVTTDGLARILVEDGTIVARDDFRLPECHVGFEAGNDADSKSRTLVIERPGAVIARKQYGSSPLRPLKIVAYLKQGRAAETSAVIQQTEEKTGDGATEEPK